MGDSEAGSGGLTRASLSSYTSKAGSKCDYCVDKPPGGDVARYWGWWC